ncbi:MAG: type I 3-dehydroquinate dehydratase [Nitrosopumilaceae archaeon]|nr:type I 3-dehydroquinate dehydratase [Nitrosopumilaceae archaeon]NIU00120.1 type I 3-dehydroquinate dehydratase [Nitrosopumilaceae archaeon]NIU86510.1 type I 3-dehydroquinate dehydratase [Nitrosopumilaceae archaeon]NIV65745.1 type I 3-dehydroquinate dehydratase [Nitrosopumilaceae archaeon]NIX60722.1 type I 3-dehydroquinate dehydratase [Nitrosopumilaceae archaeon]
MRYKTCITIGQKTPKKLVQFANKALQKSEFVELRLDFLNPKDVPRTLELLKNKRKKLVCTLRPKTEGGKFSGSEKERLSIIKLISEYDPYLLDVEYKAIRTNHSLKKYLRNSNLLVSWHDFKKTPLSKQLFRQLSQMRKQSKNVKIVTTAKTLNDVARILSLYSKSQGLNLIAFAMGDIGRISRILSIYLGSPYAYVSFGKAIAPGQLSLEELRKILTLNPKQV